MVEKAQNEKQYRLVDIGEGHMAYIVEPRNRLYSWMLPEFLCQHCHDVNGEDVPLESYHVKGGKNFSYTCKKCNTTFHLSKTAK